MSSGVSVGIIGSGPAGLITAHVLAQDGFDVTILTRDKEPGGVWTKERIYPGLTLNNVHGELRFSAMEMSPPRDASKTGGRLGGEDMQRYMSDFADKFLEGKILYGKNVVQIKRVISEQQPWGITVRNLDEAVEVYRFDKVVLCSGAYSIPHFPAGLSPELALTRGFKGPVVHSMHFAPHIEALLSCTKRIDNPAGGEDQIKPIVVVGGGKSAEDIAAYLANEGRKVTIIFDTLDAFSGSVKPLPDFLRKSRFLAIFCPAPKLRTRLERFLHQTRLGSMIVRLFWRMMEKDSFDEFEIPPDSPLRNTHPPFWSIRYNDEGCKRDNSFFSLCNAGKIEIISPARVTGYDGNSITLNNGTSLDAAAVVFATGYASSWEGIFDEETKRDLGIGRHLPPAVDVDEWESYITLKNPPPSREADQWASSIYRGIVPANNILRKDFAVNGAVVTTHKTYVLEVNAHWISSYMLGDPMNLPSTPTDAMREVDKDFNWVQKRWPNQLQWLSDSFSAAVVFFCWPQHVDQLLEDMGLRSMRSGGNWFTWPFKIVSVQELATLKEERDARRA